MEQRRQIFGPYQHRARWRLVISHGGGRNSVRSYATREEAEAALRVARALLEAQGPQLLADALDAYEVWLRCTKQNKPATIATTMIRLVRFFGGRTGPIRALTPARCERDYARISATMATDSHRNMLAEAKTFGRWLVGQRSLKANPLEEIKGTGKRRHGKPQLRLDEARRWEDIALWLAESGEEGAFAVLLALGMGLRAGEIVRLVVRDVDDAGRLLHVAEAKTAAGVRKVRVPEHLRELLARRVKGKLPLASLWSTGHWRDWVRKWTARICTIAGVPVVSAHGMRGLHASLALQAGASGEAVALALGHASAAVTRQSYASAESVAGETEQAMRATMTGRQDE